MLGNFVFDIDGTLAIALDYEAEKHEKAIKEKFDAAFIEKYRLTAANYPHYIYPGYYALFKWLHTLGGKIIFFSSGMEIRNVELAAKMMEKAFGDAVSEVEYKVFSRQHCVDTTTWAMQQGEGKSYQSYFYGQRKKKLAGIIVPEAELQSTLLIDDDSSYMVKGEEYNFISLRYPSDYLPQGYRSKRFTEFHRVYYLAGLFATMFEAQKEKGISLVEAAKFVQIDSEGVELSRDFYYPGTKRVRFHLKGYEILSKIDPTLTFYYPVPKGEFEVAEDD